MSKSPPVDRRLAPRAPWPFRPPTRTAQGPASSRSASCFPIPARSRRWERAIENGFRLYVNEQGGKLGGREIEYVKVDDESEPSKAADNVNKLIKRDNVDVVVGTVHSGVAMAMAKVAKENGTLLIVPECRRAGGHRTDVLAEHLPLVVLELAARAMRWASSRRRRDTRRSSRSRGSMRPVTNRSAGSRKASRKAAARS